MKLSTARSLARRINDRNGEGTATVYERYSGRCMYGAETAGVVAPHWAFSPQTLKKHARDSMGRDMIVY